jgi:hypothetical protein
MNSGSESPTWADGPQGRRCHRDRRRDKHPQRSIKLEEDRPGARPAAAADDAKGTSCPRALLASTQLPQPPGAVRKVHGTHQWLRMKGGRRGRGRGACEQLTLSTPSALFFSSRVLAHRRFLMGSASVGCFWIRLRKRLIATPASVLIMLEVAEGFVFSLPFFVPPPSLPVWSALSPSPSHGALASFLLPVAEAHLQSSALSRGECGCEIHLASALEPGDMYTSVSVYTTASASVTHGKRLERTRSKVLQQPRARTHGFTGVVAHSPLVGQKGQ